MLKKDKIAKTKILKDKTVLHLDNGFITIETSSIEKTVVRINFIGALSSEYSRAGSVSAYLKGGTNIYLYEGQYYAEAFEFINDALLNYGRDETGTNA